MNSPLVAPYYLCVLSRKIHKCEIATILGETLKSAQQTRGQCKAIHYIMCEVIDKGEDNGMESSDLELSASRGKTDKDSGGENEEEQRDVESKKPIHFIYLEFILLDFSK